MNALFGTNLFTAVLFSVLVAGFVDSCADEKYNALTAEYSQFKGSAEAAGKAQKAAAQKQADADNKAKRKADEDYLRRAAADRSAIGGLRKQLDTARDSRGGHVPSAPAGSRCPDGFACFDRAELERALRELTAEVRGLADESAKVEAGLNVAKAWAQR